MFYWNQTSNWQIQFKWFCSKTWAMKLENLEFIWEQFQQEWMMNRKWKYWWVMLIICKIQLKWWIIGTWFCLIMKIFLPFTSKSIFHISVLKMKLSMKNQIQIKKTVMNMTHLAHTVWTIRQMNQMQQWQALKAKVRNERMIMDLWRLEDL